MQIIFLANLMDLVVFWHLLRENVKFFIVVEKFFHWVKFLSIKSRLFKKVLFWECNGKH